MAIPYECPHQYRKKGDVTLFCRVLERQGYLPICEQEYYCPAEGKYILGPGAKGCILLKTEGN